MVAARAPLRAGVAYPWGGAATEAGEGEGELRSGPFYCNTMGTSLLPDHGLAAAGDNARRGRVAVARKGQANCNHTGRPGQAGRVRRGNSPA